MRICFAPDDAAASGAPAPEAAPAATDNNTGIDHSSEAVRIFEFDAFGPDSGGLPSGEAPASDGQGVTQTPAQPPAAPAGQPAQAPAATQPNTPATPTAPAPGAAPAAGQLTPEEAALLRQQVQDMRTALEVANRGGGGQEPGTGGQQPQTQTPAVQLPAHGYAFNIPPQTAAMLTSENPQERIAATTALITGASRIVHEQVVQSVREEFGQVIPHVVSAIVEQRLQAKAVFDDFYGTFKELNRPELRTLIQQVGQQVRQEYGNPNWSPQLRDAIGTRVRQVLSGAAPLPQGMQPSLQQQQQQPPAPVQQPAQPPHMTGTTSRPAPATLPSQQAEMAALLDFRN